MIPQPLQQSSVSAPMYDPWASALEAKEPPQILYGELLLDLFFCALVKGLGRVPFDPHQHKDGQRRTAVSLSLSPLADSGLTFAVERQFIAENKNDGWLAVTLPSIRELGITDLRAIHERYVKVEMVDYGTYEKDGQKKSLSAPKILTVYPSNAACVQAFNEETGNGHVPDAAAADMPTDEINRDLGLAANGNGNGHSNGNEKLKATALAFLPTIVRQCRDGNGMDLSKLRVQLSSMPLVKDYFSETSPEVMTEIQKVLAEPAF